MGEASHWLPAPAGADRGLAQANSVFYIGPLCIGILTGHIVGGAHKKGESSERGVGEDKYKQKIFLAKPSEDKKLYMHFSD